MMNNSSRRAFISASVASFAWLLTGGQASGAAPAITAGSPCKVKGRKRTVNGVTFVCRNAKGKLVWRKSPTVVQKQVFTVRVLESAALLVVGETKVVDVPVPSGGTTGVVVTRTDSGITALRVNCTHAGFPVARVGNVLECELHGSQFEPTTGAVLNGPAVSPLFRYEATESNGGIYVTVSTA
ncbi:MAG: Rieske (2Fe-2S) protein [Actinobacteria bacterium]|nr:Rieske (2Fe-2S) protein [Actinomycetota bacterium]